MRRTTSRHVVVPGLALLVALTGLPVAVGAAQHPEVPAQCHWDGDAMEESERLLSGRYRFPPHPTVELPEDPSWTEDPLDDTNWQFQLHSLRFVGALLSAWSETGQDRYADRAVDLVTDWVEDNPRDDAPTPWAWDDHSTAARASILACTARMMGTSPWLLEALTVHGETLADPSYYAGQGNHALNQDIGLLDVANVLGRSDWATLAQGRIASLADRSISDSGVTNEQSVEYQLFNHRRYHVASDRLKAYGMEVPESLARTRKMPGFLAHATLPNGEYEALGDTDPRHAAPIAGTIAEFAATRGASGPRPRETVAMYRSEGYLFARTGWGTERPHQDEVAYSLRFGPPQGFHGHHDGASVTLYGYGRRLLVDPGKYTYDAGPWRDWFMGRTAHNVVTVEGLDFRRSSTDLVAHRSTRRLVDTTVTNDGYPGVEMRRRVIFSRRGGYLIVEDRVESATPQRYRQLWHLSKGSRPRVDWNRVFTGRRRGNLAIIQVAGGFSHVVSGATDPIQGWVAPAFNKRVKAPVVVTTKSGTKARFVTLLVPIERGSNVAMGGIRINERGFEVTIRVGRLTEKLKVTGRRATLR